MDALRWRFIHSFTKERRKRIMTIQEFKEKLDKLIAKGYADYELYTLYKNCSYCKDVDDEDKIVTFA